MTTDVTPAGNVAAYSSGLVMATSAALVTLIPIAASQLGLLHHLPDPPSRIFDSDKITGSPLVRPFGIPDSLLGMASYSATLGLILLARERPLARKLLAMKLIADGVAAGVSTTRQITSFRKLCSWCMATAICTTAMVVAGRKVIASELSGL